MVIPFRNCIARPPKDGKEYLLIDHLERVANGWSRGLKDHQGILFYLGGLCHDVGKAQKKWQEYIKDIKGQKGKRPKHSPIGGFLFAYIAEEYIKVNNLDERQYFFKVALIIRDILDHHVDLKDIKHEEVPWHGMINKEQLRGMDMEGFKYFIEDKVPILKGKINFNIEEMEKWRLTCESKWESKSRKRKNLDSSNRLEAAENCLRVSTAAFIMADRLDAANIEISEASTLEFQHAKEKLLDICNEKNINSMAMNEMRSSVQKKILEVYLENEGKSIYTLSLPTGERVIIVTGCINVLVSRVSGTLTKYNSCIA